MAHAIDFSPGFSQYRALNGRWKKIPLTAAQIEAATAGREDYLSGLDMEHKCYESLDLQCFYEEAYRAELFDHCDVVRAVRDGTSPPRSST